MSSLTLKIRDAGPLEVAVEEEEIPSEDAADMVRSIQACLAEPWPTATTHVACDI